MKAEKTYPQKVFYKIVIQGFQKNTFYSLINRDKLRVIYRKGEWAFPKMKTSKLFVFDTIFHAHRFRLNVGIAQKQPCFLFKCHATNPSKIRNIVELSWQVDTEEIRNFWRLLDKDSLTRKQFNELFHLRHCYEGVSLVSSIKLIRQLPWSAKDKESTLDKWAKRQRLLTPST